MAKKKTVKRRKSPKKEKTEDFFVAINDPSTVRVTLLENTKSVLEAGKIFHKLKAVRKEKMEEKRLLRKEVRIITATINKIKSTIPTVAMPSVDTIPTKKTAPKPKKVFKEKKAPMTEIDRIEADLKAIEEKLSNIS